MNKSGKMKKTVKDMKVGRINKENPNERKLEMKNWGN